MITIYEVRSVEYDPICYMFTELEAAKEQVRFLEELNKEITYPVKYVIEEYNIDNSILKVVVRYSITFIKKKQDLSRYATLEKPESYMKDKTIETVDDEVIFVCGYNKEEVEKRFEEICNETRN